MDGPVPETNKYAEEAIPSRVASPSRSNFEGKIAMVTPKRVFYIYVEDLEREIIKPEQETGTPASAEFVI